MRDVLLLFSFIPSVSSMIARHKPQPKRKEAHHASVAIRCHPSSLDGICNVQLLFLLSGHVELEEADVAVLHGIIAALLTVFPDETHHA
jgi:hypothetical protein